MQRRSDAADAVDRAARSLAAIEAEIASVRREMTDVAAPDRASIAESRRAALLEADALHRSSRRERRRSLAPRLERLESEARRARADLDAAKEGLAQAIRQVEILSDGVR